MEPKYYNKTVPECTYLPCANKKSEWGGKLRACSRCSIAGKAVAWYCSIKCQKSDWPRHKVQCNADQEAKASRSETAQKTLEDMIIWDRKNRPKLISAAISALDLCHYPENADEYVFVVQLIDTPGAKHRYTVGFANAVSFEQYESIFSNRAGDPRVDQRIGQERAKAKSPSCISFQIVEVASNDGCRNTFQTWLMPKDLHGYRIAGFGVPNWGPILAAQCRLPKTPPPPIQLLSPRFDGNLTALRAWRDLYLNDIYSAAIDALGLGQDPSAQQLLIIYLRCTGRSEISEMILLENAFVYSLEEAAITLDESVWKAVERLGNSRPQTETQAAAGLVPCVVCQVIDPIDLRSAPTFVVPVHGRKRTWKEHLAASLGGGVLRDNLVLLQHEFLF
ncbi:hypothetical protein B0H14DRAFT_2842980 [Mycena olivaceomarginata]|nr:hypothetical protein B0H14DRAFT_2842980 [Mycena olivaceomarginata]